tara:strand:- start:1544 stop:1891 length:348 start_codon:yes stop_codon:yes gene_type:complete
MEEIIEKKTVKGNPNPPKKMSVNEQITVARFYGRLVISFFAFGIFLYIVHMMLIADVEMAQSSRDLLNILIGSFISVISGIATFYFNGDSDLMEDKSHLNQPNNQPPQNDTSTTS